MKKNTLHEPLPHDSSSSPFFLCDNKNTIFEVAIQASGTLTGIRC